MLVSPLTILCLTAQCSVYTPQDSSTSGAAPALGMLLSIFRYANNLLWLVYWLCLLRGQSSYAPHPYTWYLCHSAEEA